MAAAAEEAPVPAHKKFNIKQYRGLVESVNNIKEVVERDRSQAALREKGLQERLQRGESEAATIQRELSVQLRCAGRSYQQLLGANRELTEQLREENESRREEKEGLEQQVKELRQRLNAADRPWKEEVAKREGKILRLQEAAREREGQLREAGASLQEERERGLRELEARDEKAAALLREVDAVREEARQEALRAEERLEAEKKKALAERTALTLELSEVRAQKEGTAAPLERTIQEQELKIAGLERQLADVDYSIYERKIRLKEQGYNRLVKDFGVKQKMNEQSLERMRTGFEEVIQKMDRRIQDAEKATEAKMAPLRQDIKKKEARIELLTKQVEEQRSDEAKVRRREAAERAELERELEAAKESVDLATKEAVQLKREIERMKEMEDSGSLRRKVFVLETMLEDATRKCEELVRHKDRELREKSDLVSRLQQHVRELTEAASAADRDFDSKVQKKEEGYQLLVAQLAYAEGQIVEERQRTAAAVATIKRRDETIARLEGEHSLELSVRLADRKELQARVSALEAEVDEGLEREEELRRRFEVEAEAAARRNERRVRDLHVELARETAAKKELDAALTALREEFEKARSCWEDKERDLQISLRTRDRAIVSLKNEIEFLQDSFEIKYNRLMSLFEKLQKKYDELLGPNGVAETLRRARDLKQENEALVGQIAELKEMLKKQKRQIRDLQLDIDMHMKETADLVHRKELGMTKLVGQNAELEAKLREEKEVRERLIAELVQEKRDMVASFQARVEQLEQLVESMRFTDRQELLEKIATWKKAYERICVERDDLEEEYKQLIDVKDTQLLNLAAENNEALAKVQEERLKGEKAVDEAEERWKAKHRALQLERQRLEKELVDLGIEHEKAKAKASRSMAALEMAPRDDAEKEGLRGRVKELEGQLEAVEEGKQRIIEENTELLKSKETVEQQLEQSKEDWEPQIRWRDERYEAMVKEHEALKGVLAAEMKKAQDACKDVEEQVRRFPSPFELELEELRGKYAQTQAGLFKLSRENVALKEELLDVREEAAREREQLEEGLRMASHILKEVASLGALKALSKAEVSSLETALGVDLDDDGRVG